MPRITLITCICLLGMSAATQAQQGDRTGEIQPTLPETFDRPVSPARSAEEQLQSFALSSGFKIELVASEPLIEDPVAMSFDASGRLWVVEMRGYMNDIDGSDETRPIGRIVVLIDDDDDGRMDRSIAFLENLILPRAIASAHDGILFVEPPHLMHARDLDGDLRADDVRILASGFGGIENPEHAGNGLAWGIDGWLECSQHPYRYRLLNDADSIAIQSVRPHGQWGVAVDDLGRCWYSPNSEPLLVDLFPKHYAARNIHQNGFHGVGVAVATTKRVRPAMRTPGVNRGYQKNVLDETGRLSSFTGACGPGVYRDDLLGSDVRGDLFVCEVAGNLIKRFDVTEMDDGSLKADPVDDPIEFLTSTDERFRPVQTMTGPDGALYICDMYRGIIQHRIYMTSFLRRQVESRGLEKPAALGRIWRIVPEEDPVREIVDLRKLMDHQLVERLFDLNGTTRDNAQRLLIERASISSVPRIREMISVSHQVEDRLRGLWTLHALGAANPDDLQAASSDPDPLMRRAGLRISESVLNANDLLKHCRSSLKDNDENVRVQAMLSVSVSDDSRVLEVLSEGFSSDPSSHAMRSAIRSSLGGRQLELLDQAAMNIILHEHSPTNRAMLQDAVDQVLRSRDPESTSDLLSFVAKCSSDRDWQRRLVIDRFASRMALGSEAPRTIRITRPPPGWPELIAGPPSPTVVRARAVDDNLVWPQRSGYLDEAIQSAVDFNDPDSVLARGRRLYVNCLSCHQGDGRGLYPVYPPLVESEFVRGDPSRLISIVLHGLEGPITVRGLRYQQSMPPVSLGSDEDIAAVLTYVRHAWGNESPAVTPSMVSKVRESTRDRQGPLRAADLIR
jgi:mono/diheme cytochrome c family protein/glucose/arabinose dehydrogenase